VVAADLGVWNGSAKGVLSMIALPVKEKCLRTRLFLIAEGG
jgi:hypothetical protein